MVVSLHLAEVSLLDVVPDKIVKYEDTYSITFDMILQKTEFEVVADIIQQKYVEAVTGNC